MVPSAVHGKVNLGAELNPKDRAWKHIWTVGPDDGQIGDIPMTAELMHRLHQEFMAASHRLADRTGLLRV